MPTVKLIVRGKPNDHLLYSSELDNGEAERQLALIADAQGTVRSPELGWAAVQGKDIVAAEILDREAA